jgi:hypothetical protein
VAPLSANCLRRTSLLVLLAAAGSRSRPANVGEPQPEIDRLDGINELVASSIALQRSKDFEAIEIEVVQHE